MRSSPDARRDVSVTLTTEEIGRAIANRGDDEQVEILCHLVRGFDSYSQAELQASYIGGRLFSRASESDVENVIRFLRMMLFSCAADAKKIHELAHLPEVQL